MKLRISYNDQLHMERVKRFMNFNFHNISQ